MEFICAECGLKVSHRISLISHIRLKHGDAGTQKLTCADCGISYWNELNFKKHLKTCSSQQSTSTPPLEGSSSSLPQPSSSTSGHCPPPQPPHPPPPKYQCTECGKLFTWRSGLCRHWKSHYPTGPQMCSFCCKTFTRKLDLKRHLHFHCDVIKERQTYAMKKNSTQQLMSDTMSSLDPQSPSSTPQPGSSSLPLPQLTPSTSGQCPPPLPSPPPPPTYQCEYCGKLFHGESGLRRHLKSHDANGLKLDSLPTTGPQPPTSTPPPETSSLTLSLPSSSTAGQCPPPLPPLSSPTKFKCPHCEKSFSWRSSLWRHLKSHSPESTTPVQIDLTDQLDGPGIEQQCDRQSNLRQYFSEFDPWFEEAISPSNLDTNDNLNITLVEALENVTDEEFEKYEADQQ